MLCYYFFPSHFLSFPLLIFSSPSPTDINTNVHTLSHLLLSSSNSLSIIIFCRLSASCVRVSGPLHDLVALNPHKQAEQPQQDLVVDDEIVPIPSRICEWTKPRRQKEKALKMTDACFKKHKYEKVPKQKQLALEDYDPRPLQYRGNASSLLPELLVKS